MKKVCLPYHLIDDKIMFFQNNTIKEITEVPDLNEVMQTVFILKLLKILESQEKHEVI
jgi:hypothetical protein